MSKLIQIFSFSFFSLFLSNLIFSQQVVQDWVSRFNGAANNQDYSYAIATDANGNSYITGQTYSSATKNDIVTIKYDSYGSPLWIQIYNGSLNLNDAGIGIKVDNSGNVYVTGNTESFYSGTAFPDIITIKYDPSGILQWTKIYDGPVHTYDLAHGIALDDNGNVYITGESYGITADDYVTIKYSPDGIMQWISRYNGPVSNDVATSITIDNSFNVIVTGYSQGTGTFYDYATVKYNSSGIQQWVQRFSGNADDIARSIAVDNSGNICITGSSIGTVTGKDYATIMYSPSGTMQWVQIYNDVSNGTDEAFSVAFDNSGNLYVSGNSPGSGTNADFATIKYNSSGIMQWIQKYNGIAGGADYARSLALDVQGNVYVSGYSSGTAANYDYATIKYNPDGLLKWVQRYNSTVNNLDIPTMVIVDASNNVFVTGYSWGGLTMYDMATVKYYQCTLNVNAGNDTTIYKGYGAGTATLTANITGGVSPISFSWSNGATTQTIVVTPDQTTSYWVNVTDAKGCTASDTVTVTVINVSCGTPGNSKVIVCHKGNTLCVDESSVLAHLAHGDILGPCNSQQKVFDESAAEFKLFPNYPNPFNPITKIMFNLPVKSKVKLEIFDAAGKDVVVLINGELPSGINSITWDGANYSSGIYFYRIVIYSDKLEAGNFTEIKKMILIK